MNVYTSVKLFVELLCTDTVYVLDMRNPRTHLHSLGVQVELKTAYFISDAEIVLLWVVT